MTSEPPTTAARRLPDCTWCYSPLHWLQVVQKRTETAAAFKQHGAKAPVVHGDGVGLVLEQLRRLRRSGFLRFCVASLGKSYRRWGGDSAHQVLQRSDKGGAQAALVQVFGVAQVDDLVNQLRKRKERGRVSSGRGAKPQTDSLPFR